jgi:hypothetical protein
VVSGVFFTAALVSIVAPYLIRSDLSQFSKKKKTEVCACADRIDLETSLATGTDRLEDIPASIGSSN